MELSETKKWKRLQIIVTLLVLSLVLAACAGGTNSEKGDPETTKETSEGGDLVLAVLSDVSSLDPAMSTDVPSSVVQANMFETLVKNNEDNEIVAGLAVEWDSVDERTYEFKLREGVKFHDGEDFNAEVVKMNLERLLDEEVASPRYFLFEMIERIDVIDEYTVQITTEYPFAPIYAQLTHTSSGMISPKSIEADYAALSEGKKAGTVISSAPVGTGYFKFEHWKPGDEIKLVKNEAYWGDLVHIDSATFKVVPESTTRIADLERGFVHITDPLEPIEVNDVNSGDYAKVLQKPSASLSYIGFNTDKEPFDNPKVRQAISLLIDRDEIIEGIYEGFGIPAKGPLAPSIFGYNQDAEPFEKDLEKAKKLLEEAGYADGFSTSIWTNDNQQRIDMAILLQNSLKELNIDAKVEQMEFGAYLNKIGEGEHDMFILGWSNATGDADNTLYALFHSLQKGPPGNRTFYDNPEVDQLLAEGRREIDPEKRVEIYNKVQQHLIEDAPMIYIHHQEYLLGVSNQITGFDVDVGGIYQLQNVQFLKE